MFQNLVFRTPKKMKKQTKENPEKQNKGGKTASHRHKKTKQRKQTNTTRTETQQKKIQRPVPVRPGPPGPAPRRGDVPDHPGPEPTSSKDKKKKKKPQKKEKKRFRETSRTAGARAEPQVLDRPGPEMFSCFCGWVCLFFFFLVGGCDTRPAKKKKLKGKTKSFGAKTKKNEKKTLYVPDRRGPRLAGRPGPPGPVSNQQRRTDQITKNPKRQQHKKKKTK